MNQDDNFDYDFPFDEFREEPLPPEEAEESRPSPNSKGRHRPQRVQKKNPVVVYLSILFAVAFLLLLLSFFTQQRDHATLQELNVNLGTQQETIEDLTLEKQQLTLELQEAKENVDNAESAKADAEKAATTAQKTAQALEYLAQMEKACRTSYLEGYRIAKEMESKGLADYLPTTSSVSGCSSPAQVYQGLCSTLFGDLS